MRGKYEKLAHLPHVLLNAAIRRYLAGEAPNDPPLEPHKWGAGDTKVCPFPELGPVSPPRKVKPETRPGKMPELY